MKIAINGFGRIGKQFFISALQQKVPWEFVINENSEKEYIIYSLKHDSIHPSIRDNVKFINNLLIVGNKRIPIYSEKDPKKIPWKKEKIDLVVECTGAFTNAEKAIGHLKTGVKKILISAPAKNHDITIVPGVNDSKLKKEHKIVSAGSCTTNCIAPMLKVIQDEYGIKKAQFITTHAYTSTQKLIDGYTRKDLSRGRTAAMNIVPTSSGASTSVEECMPEIKGKLAGYSLRVPVIDGSISTIVAHISRKTTAKSINSLFKKRSLTDMKGILEYTEDPLVSTDIINNPSSCIFDKRLTYVIDDLINIAGWYDNEWGYACRLVDVAKMMLK